MNFGERLLNAIDTAISGPAPDPHAFQKRIASLASSPLATDVELEQLRDFQKQWQAGLNFANAHGCDAAARAHREQHQRHKAALKSGESVDHAFTREHFEKSYGQKCETGKETMREAAAASQPIAAIVAGRFAALCNSLADDEAKAYAACCKKFDFEYSDSPLVLALRETAVDAVRRASQPSPPQRALPFLDL